MVSSFETQCSSLPGGPVGGSRYGDMDSMCPSGPMDDMDACSIAAPSVTCSMCSHSTGGATGHNNYDVGGTLMRRTAVDDSVAMSPVRR